MTTSQVPNDGEEQGKETSSKSGHGYAHLLENCTRKEGRKREGEENEVDNKNARTRVLLYCPIMDPDSDDVISWCPFSFILHQIPNIPLPLPGPSPSYPTALPPPLLSSRTPECVATDSSLHLDWLVLFALLTCCDNNAHSVASC